MIANWLDPVYLFNRNLGPFTSKLAYLVLAFFFLVMLASWLIKKKALKTGDIFAKKASRRFFVLVWTMGWIGAVLWAFRQINVAYLSAPILFLLWFMVGLVWLVFVAKYWLIDAPARRRKLSTEVVKKQYLPK